MIILVIRMFILVIGTTSQAARMEILILQRNQHKHRRQEIPRGLVASVCIGMHAFVHCVALMLRCFCAGVSGFAEGCLRVLEGLAVAMD